MYTRNKKGGDQGMAQIQERPITAKDLREAGIILVPAGEIFKGWPKPKRKIRLEEVHKHLSRFRGSMADIVARMREGR